MFKMAAFFEENFQFALKLATHPPYLLRSPFRVGGSVRAE